MALSASDLLRLGLSLLLHSFLDRSRVLKSMLRKGIRLFTSPLGIYFGSRKWHVPLETAHLGPNIQHSHLYSFKNRCQTH